MKSSHSDARTPPGMAPTKRRIRLAASSGVIEAFSVDERLPRCQRRASAAQHAAGEFTPSGAVEAGRASTSAWPSRKCEDWRRAGARQAR